MRARLGGSDVTRDGVPLETRLATDVGCAAVLIVEILGSLLIWAPIPFAWLWVGGRVYSATGSLATDLGVAFIGFVASIVVVAATLNRIDEAWVVMRRRAGRDQAEGILSRLMVVSGTVMIVLFLLWYYVLSDAVVLPFMGTQQ
jgi:hypothetical protein